MPFSIKKTGITTDGNDKNICDNKDNHASFAAKCPSSCPSTPATVSLTRTGPVAHILGLKKDRYFGLGL